MLPLVLGWPVPGGLSGPLKDVRLIFTYHRRSKIAGWLLRIQILPDRAVV